MSEELRREQDEINAADKAHATRIRSKLNDRIVDLETSLTHVLDRLHQLEEKERARSRDEHAEEMNLDRLGYSAGRE